jgi:hypothetical protein
LKWADCLALAQSRSHAVVDFAGWLNRQDDLFVRSNETRYSLIGTSISWQLAQELFYFALVPGNKLFDNDILQEMLVCKQDENHDGAMECFSKLSNTWRGLLLYGTKDKEYLYWFTACRAVKSDSNFGSNFHIRFSSDSTVFGP